MTNKILLSIVMPTYNSEKFVSDSLSSIYCDAALSRMNDFEVVVIDDGSSDKTLEICKAFSEKFKNINVIRLMTNYGVSAARNRGITESKGNYITFMDSDDLFLEDWVENLDVLDDGTKLDVVINSKFFENSPNKTKYDLYTYIFTYNKENIRLSGPYSKFFRTSFLRKNKILFNESLINGEDLLFNLYTVEKCKSFALRGNSFYVVRHNDYSTTSNFDRRIYESEKKMNESIANFIDKNKQYGLAMYKNIMRKNTVRTLCYRISRLEKYQKARIEYDLLREKIILDGSCDGDNIYIRLLRRKFYYILYKMCRMRRPKTEYLETL